MLPAVFALLPWCRQYQGSSEDFYYTDVILLPSLKDCKIDFYITLTRLQGPVSSDRTQPGASSCWTCGGPTSPPTVPAVVAFHLHPSVLPPRRVDLSTHPGCLGTPTSARAEGYQRCVTQSTFQRAVYLFSYSAICCLIAVFKGCYHGVMFGHTQLVL